MRETPSRGHTRRAPMDFSVPGRSPSGRGPLATEPREEVVQVIVTRIADDQFPRALFSRLDLDFGSDLLGQFLLQTRDVAVRPLSAPGLGRRLKVCRDAPLCLPLAARLLGASLRVALLLPSPWRETL